MLKKHLLAAAVLVSVIAGCSKNDGNSGRNTNQTYNVTSTLNVQYGHGKDFSGNDEKLLLDIYSPVNASATNKYPLIVLVHGGSFLEGDKDNLKTLCQALAEKGFITVSIDYRLGWDYGNKGPAFCEGNVASLQDAVYRSMQDLHASLRFLIHNAGKYSINTNWIFTGGASAGAVAAVNTIYTTQAYADAYYAKSTASLGPLFTADNTLTDAVNIDGDINMWGAVANDSLITAVTAVPMVAFHGSEDDVIPLDTAHYVGCSNYPLLYGSRDMYNKLQSLGVPAVLHIAQNQGHGPDMYTNDPDFVADNVDCFLQGVIGKVQKTATFNNMANGCQ